MSEKVRESIVIDEDKWGDFTSEGPWELNGEVYKFVETYLTNDCDGECNNVIVKRESDNKFFHFHWEEYREKYYFGEELEEVFPKTMSKTKYE